MDERRPTLSVIMPALDEEGTIEEVIREVYRLPNVRELIAVDDGSSDRTPEILAALREEFGDRIIHDVTRALHRTFVTPIDREDILELAGRLDDVVDAIDEGAQYILEYKLEEPTHAAQELADIIVECANELERAIALLSSKNAKLRDILPITVEINRLENMADKVTSRARGELFSNGSDMAYILKWRDVYDDLEEATDRAEDAANVLEGIVLKHS